MSDELKPCPFCGGKGREYFNGNSLEPEYVIHCDDCSTETGSTYGAKAEAIAAWNQRHRPTCETCGWWEGSKWVGPCGNPVVSNSLNDETEKDFGCIYHEPKEDQSDE